MLGSGFIYVSMFLIAIGNLVPLVWGISKTREASDFGAVSLLALWVYVGQLALFVVSAVIMNGKGVLADILRMIFADGTGKTYLSLLVSGSIGYLTVFAVLASCSYFCGGRRLIDNG